MPADAALLDKLKSPEQVNWDKYKDAGDYVPPPVPKNADGSFIQFKGQAPASFKFDATKEGYLSVTIDPIVITGEAGKGYQLRFTRASAKKFVVKNEQIERSMLGNYLRSIDKALKPQTNQEYVRAVESTARRSFTFTADWECYDSESGTTIAGKYEDFPEDPKNPGKRQPWIELPDKRRLFARMKVKNFVAVK